ncbi:hypothetical protein [Sorangium sp. So ce1153]|uniref:hypothetical protein n=1 Tax=Sorangium sp. So ce1153 TaxID=3133333 RepID=UPI003F5F5551
MPFKVDEPWLLPFLRCVRQRPGMYLGNNSVRTLETYILGYTQARIDLGIPEFGAGESALLESFGKWLASASTSRMNLGWAGYVEFVDPSCDNVHTFFKKFDEFLREQGMSLDEGMADAWPPDGWTTKG